MEQKPRSSGGACPLRNQRHWLDGERPSVALKNTTVKESKRMRAVKTSCPFYSQAARAEILEDLGKLTPKCILWTI